MMPQAHACCRTSRREPVFTLRARLSLVADRAGAGACRGVAPPHAAALCSRRAHGGPGGRGRACAGARAVRRARHGAPIRRLAGLTRAVVTEGRVAGARAEDRGQVHLGERGLLHPTLNLQAWRRVLALSAAACGAGVRGVWAGGGTPQRRRCLCPEAAQTRPDRAGSGCSEYWSAAPAGLRWRREPRPRCVGLPGLAHSGLTQSRPSARSAESQIPSDRRACPWSGRRRRRA